MTVFRDPAVPLSPGQAEMRKRVLKEIEKDPGGFDMSSWESGWRTGCGQCGTTRCIAGWAQYLERGAVYENGLGRDVPSVWSDAIGLLGLTFAEYTGEVAGDDDLFYMDDDQALERLRELASVEAG